MANRNLGYGGMFSTADTSQMSIGSKLMQGGVPPSLLGLQNHGGSAFAGIAHRTEAMKRFQNLVDNGVDQEVFLTVEAMVNGKKEPVSTPFMFNGKEYVPNSDGKVRIANSTNVKLAKEIRDYQEDKTDKIMELCILGDDIAPYVLGLTSNAWIAMCSSGGKPVADTRIWSADMLAEDCRIEIIESLVDGSISQTKALSKLRKIVKFYLNNVNLEDFDSVAERKGEMSTGKNNPTVGLNAKGPQLVPGAVAAMQAAAADAE